LERRSSAALPEAVLFFRSRGPLKSSAFTSFLHSFILLSLSGVI
jgi:hypothetical protein